MFPYRCCLLASCCYITSNFIVTTSPARPPTSRYDAIPPTLYEKVGVGGIRDSHGFLVKQAGKNMMARSSFTKCRRENKINQFTSTSTSTSTLASGQRKKGNLPYLHDLSLEKGKCSTPNTTLTI